ncbi:hypothetical protein C0J52_20711 [Blattella germanica]|nr:hypothetical protein C0J52_20711 [Blattella germanica]
MGIGSSSEEEDDGEGHEEQSLISWMIRGSLSLAMNDTLFLSSLFLICIVLISGVARLLARLQHVVSLKEPAQKAGQYQQKAELQVQRLETKIILNVAYNSDPNLNKRNIVRNNHIQKTLQQEELTEFGHLARRVINEELDTKYGSRGLMLMSWGLHVYQGTIQDKTKTQQRNEGNEVCDQLSGLPLAVRTNSQISSLLRSNDRLLRINIINVVCYTWAQSKEMELMLGNGYRTESTSGMQASGNYKIPLLGTSFVPVLNLQEIFRLIILSASEFVPQLQHHSVVRKWLCYNTMKRFKTHIQHTISFIENQICKITIFFQAVGNPNGTYQAVSLLLMPLKQSIPETQFIRGLALLCSSSSTLLLLPLKVSLLLLLPPPLPPPPPLKSPPLPPPP